MRKRLLLIGGGGHCHSVLDAVLAMNEYDEIGIVDYVDCSYCGVSVVGTDEDLPSLFEAGWKYAFITVGSVGNTGIRRRLYENVKAIGFTVPVIADPSAVIARDAVIEEGAFVGKRAVVNAGSKIGRCSIINTGAITEHDCEVGEFAHISPGAVLCGQVKAGADTHIGAGSVVRQQISIGDGTLVGIGSVVVKDLPGGIKAYGNPCKRR